jgi:hypothetical protein
MAINIYDLVQMIGYLYFINGEDFYGHKHFLKLFLRCFNLGFWFISPLYSFFNVKFNEYITVP